MYRCRGGSRRKFLGGNAPQKSPPCPTLSCLSPLRSRLELRLEGLGERISSPSGSGRSATTKRILVHCRHKFALFDCINEDQFNTFSLH